MLVLVRVSAAVVAFMPTLRVSSRLTVAPARLVRHTAPMIRSQSRVVCRSMGCMMRCACLLVIVSLQQRPAPNGSVRGVVSCLGLVGSDGVVLYGFECVAFRLGEGSSDVAASSFFIIAKMNRAEMRHITMSMAQTI